MGQHAGDGSGPVTLDGSSTGRIAVVVGTRPEIIKVAPVVRALGARAEVVYTGQHYDDALSGAFFDTFGLPRPAAVVEIGGRTRGEQIGIGVQGLSRLWAAAPPVAVVVQGDTNSALAGGLAANACGIPLVHVEAGLRSFDRAMPEEHNRVLVDRISDLLLAPTEVSRANLLAERIDRPIVVTGNTVVEAVAAILPDPAERMRLVERQGLTATAFVLVTIHRPENTDDPERLAALLTSLAKLDLPVVLPLHPRTRARVQGFGLGSLLTPLEVSEPLDYRTFLALSAEAAVLVSDSGGVQEEVSVYKRPVVVVRRSTERPEVLGSFATLATPWTLHEQAVAWLEDLAGVHRRLAATPSPYGDGDAGERSARAIHELLG
jgi:UDP-N-acetylglucosamine 2-epimerase (non-hydrolysing)